GPLVGGFAAQLGPLKGGFTAPWTWPIWELMWLSAFCLVFLFFLFPETSANNILLRRTRRLRKLTGNQRLTCEPELMAENMTARDIVLMSLVRPFTLNFTEPMVFMLNLYIALIYGLLYIWFESFVIVFVEIYGFTLGEEGLSFLGIFVGACIVIPPFFLYLHYYLEPKFDENGELQPEERLPPCFIGAFCIPICLFWFGWSARPSIHWIMPIIGSGWFAIGAFLLFQAILNYLPDAYPNHAASVLAGNDFMRSAFGAGFPLFATAMYKNLGVGWASSTLAFISIAFIPIPFILYKLSGQLADSISTGIMLKWPCSICCIFRFFSAIGAARETTPYGGQFGFDMNVEDASRRYDQSRKYNPSFLAGVLWLFVSHVERVFVFALMPNGTDQGNANYDNMAPFFLNETFPPNWYRGATPWTAPQNFGTAFAMYFKGFRELGANVGLDNLVPFGIDISSKTPEDLTCFVVMNLLDLIPAQLQQPAFLHTANLLKALLCHSL
ncbi:hypothetical protein Golomagni_06572, partial [Golovinomyces magnicellulatus]